MGQSNGVLLKEMSFYRGLTVCVYSRTSGTTTVSRPGCIKASFFLLTAINMQNFTLSLAVSEPFIISILYLK